jgi:hypothetical protein
LDDRIYLFCRSDRRLALLEIRLLIAYFVWYFDAELVHHEEPAFEDRFVARRGVLDIRVQPIRTVGVGESEDQLPRDA